MPVHLPGKGCWLQTCTPPAHTHTRSYLISCCTCLLLAACSLFVACSSWATSCLFQAGTVCEVCGAISMAISMATGCRPIHTVGTIHHLKQIPHTAIRVHFNTASPWVHSGTCRAARKPAHARYQANCKAKARSLPPCAAFHQERQHTPWPTGLAQIPVLSHTCATSCRTFGCSGCVMPASPAAASSTCPNP